MKTITTFAALFASTPALAHHEGTVVMSSHTGVFVGVAVIAFAAVIANRNRVVATK